MKQIINIQLSTFGAYGGIHATPEVVSALIPYFSNELMPSFFELKAIDPIKNIINNDNRLRLLSVDNQIELVFLPDRIDCNFTLKNDSVANNDMNMIAFKLKDYLEKAMQFFHTNGNRLALNGKFITDEIELNHSNYILSPNFFNNKPISEWSINMNALTEIAFSTGSELVNNILNLQLVKKTSSVEAMLIAFDINTMPQNQSMRFGSESISVFLDKALQNKDDMISTLGD